MAVTIVGAFGCSEAGADSAAREPAAERLQQQRDAASSSLDQTPRAGPRDVPLALGGSRLKAMHFVTSGAIWFRFFEDTQLGFDCEWVRTDKGELRCAPLRRATVEYLDDRCTEPVMQLTDSRGYGTQGDAVPGPRPVVGDWVSATSNQPMACTPQLPDVGGVYRVGEEVKTIDPPGPLTPFYRRTVLGCLKFTGWTPGAALYHVTPADINALAKGALRRIDVSDKLTVQRVVGEDRSEYTIGLQTNGKPCELVPDAKLCIPGNYARPLPAFAFSDPGCKGPGLYVVERVGLCTPELALMKTYEENAGEVLHVYRLTPSLRAFEEQRLSKIESSCASLSLDRLLQYGYYLPGEDVVNTLPKVRRIALGEGPLHREQFVADSDDGLTPLERGTRFMDANGKGCTIMRAPDHTLRCLPDDRQLSATGLYRDDACREALYYSFTGLRDDLTTTQAWWYQKPGALPAELPELFSVKPYSGPVYGRASLPDGPCISRSLPKDETQWTRDQAVPPTVLPEVEERAL